MVAHRSARFHARSPGTVRRPTAVLRRVVAAPMMLRRALELPRAPESVPEARVFVRKTLDGSPRLDDAELIASELCTNAVMHALGDRYRVTVEASDHRCVIEVEDQGGADMPRVGALMPDSETGRGLTIVSILATSYGYRHAPSCTTIWAELSYS